jgi:predicted ATP-binding protein involved in virulence
MVTKSSKIIYHPTLVTKLEVEKFRAFSPDLKMTFGKKITLIAGQNGASKSTVLGMISQPLGFPNTSKSDSKYTNAYHNINLSQFKTITGDTFKADYSEYFKMSTQFDIPEEHKYTIYMSGDSILPTSRILEQGLFVTSKQRSDQKK